jgi:two-component system NtrC family sensor kinase
LSDGSQDVIDGALVGVEPPRVAARFSEEAHQARLAWAGRMLAGVAHEISNPLTVIQGFAHVLYARAGAEDDRRDLLCILDETRRLGALVEDMLCFTRRGREDVELVDLARVVRAAVNLTRNEMRLAGVAVVAGLGEEPLLVRAQHGACVQVLLNVLTNARQSLQAVDAAERGIGLRVARDVPGRVALLVSNNGPPIPAEDAARIFEPFFTTKCASEGSGLGLAVCREVLERSGGKITLDENGSAGVCFRLEFPAG